MAIQIDEEVDRIIYNNMVINFKLYFDSYLRINYGISEEQFKTMIINGFPERFI
jgi:hypothetical protein